jgi:hypothetical protein
VQRAGEGATSVLHRSGVKVFSAPSFRTTPAARVNTDHCYLFSATLDNFR